MSLNKLLLATAMMMSFSSVVLADEMAAPGGNMAAPASHMAPADKMAAPDSMGMAMSSKKPMKAHRHHKKDAMSAPMATPMASPMAEPTK